MRDDRRISVNHPRPDRAATSADLIAAVSAFDRRRHELARAALFPDTAADFRRPSTTAGIIEYRNREYLELCAHFRHAPDADVTPGTALEVVRALERLTDVEERHVMLTATTTGAEPLTVAERAMLHRRSLARGAPSRHDPLLSLSLVLLTHCLRTVGRHYDAVARGQESVDIVRQLVSDGRLDARPALVLALDASLSTRFELGRERDVGNRLRLASAVLREVVADDPAYGRDLDDHLAALDEIGAEWDVAHRERRRLARRQAASRATVSGGTTPPTGGRRTELHERADALYEHGVQLVTSGADGPAAVAAAGAAVAAYRRLREQPDAGGPRRVVDRKFARALWRHAITLHELLDRPRDALGPGRTGVALGRALLLATAWDAETYRRLVGEVATATHDLSRIAAASGLDDEPAELDAQVEQLSTGRDRATTRAVGAALHDRAAHAGETALALGRRYRSLTTVVAGGIAASTRAVRVRRTLVDDTEPVTRWELANSLLALGHLRCLNGEGQVGAETLVDAYMTVAALPGPSAAAMRRATCEALRGACLSYSNIEIGDDWPL